MFKGFTVEDQDDPVKILALNEKRDRAVEIFQKLALKELSNAPISVKRQVSGLNHSGKQLTVRHSSHTLMSISFSLPNRRTPSPQLRLVHWLCLVRFNRGWVEHSKLPSSDMLRTRKSTAKRNLRIMMVSFPDRGLGAKLIIDFSPEKASSEIQFLQRVAVFVGAIRCGVLDPDHAKEPLAHCGRFGATYDAVVKKLVDVLRDEGIYNRDSDTVVAISVEALQAVSSLNHRKT